MSRNQPPPGYFEAIRNSVYSAFQPRTSAQPSVEVSFLGISPTAQTESDAAQLQNACLNRDDRRYTHHGSQTPDHRDRRQRATEEETSHLCAATTARGQATGKQGWAAHTAFDTARLADLRENAYLNPNGNLYLYHDSQTFHCFGCKQNVFKAPACPHLCKGTRPDSP